MGTLKESQTQAVLDTAASRDAGTYEWWTALNFADGDLAQEPDPRVEVEAGGDEFEFRLYSV